jgi:hypothetical protein
MGTPKCASSTTKTLLWKLEGLGPLPSDIHDRRRDDRRLSALSLSLADALELLFETSVIRFRVTRDPLDRLISAYRDKVRRFPPDFARHRDKIVQHFDLPDEHHISFEHFAEYVCTTPDRERNAHWMSQRLLTLADVVPFTIVVRQEHYARDMATLYDAIGVPRKEWPSFEARINALPAGDVVVPKATVRLVEDAYSGDYELHTLTNGERTIHEYGRSRAASRENAVEGSQRPDSSPMETIGEPRQTLEPHITLAGLALALREDTASLEAQPLNAEELQRCEDLIAALRRSGGRRVS